MQIPAVPEKVFIIARAHMAFRRPLPGFRWGFVFRQCVASGWYFDYALERLPSNPPDPGSGVGGAAGFVVAHQGEVEAVSFPRLREVLGDASS